MADRLISIVMPVYNDKNHLDRSVQSVLGQSYSNIEFLATDDGSTDGSGELLEAYAAKDSRMKVFHKPNGGHSSAVNYGLDRISGDYVMVCDSDDWYEPDACAIALDAIESRPDCDVILFGFLRKDREVVDNPASLCTFDKTSADLMLLSGNTSKFCDIGYHIESTCSKIMRSDIVQKNRVRMPESLILAEDAVFCLYLYEHCRKVAFDDHHIYHYEIYDGSFCRRFSDAALRALPEILMIQSGYIEEYHPGDRAYIAANNCSVFSWINEAEDHFFFNDELKKSNRETFNDYKALLKNPVVNSHLADIRPSEVNSFMQRLRLYLYRNPNYPLFEVYRKMKMRGKQ